MGNSSDLPLAAASMGSLAPSGIPSVYSWSLWIELCKLVDVALSTDYLLNSIVTRLDSEKQQKINNP